MTAWSWRCSAAIAAVFFAGCGGGGSAPQTPIAATSPSPVASKPSASPLPSATPTPTSKASATPTPAHTATPSPSPAPSNAIFTAAQVIAALDSVQAHFKTETIGTNPEAAIASLVTWIKTQPAFKDAGADQGTIWATLADGQPAVFYVDRLADQAQPSAAYRRRRVAAEAGPLGSFFAGASSRRRNATVSNGQVLFLVNNLDRTGAFDPQRQVDFAQAFANAGYSNVAPALGISLENIVKYGSTPSDFVDVATHGGNAFNVYLQREVYDLSSTTEVTASNYDQYRPEVTAGHLTYTLTLLDPDNPNVPVDVPTYGFTSAWLTLHMKFSPGSVFFNNSCYGANVYPAGQSFVSDLNAAGVELYTGWTKSVLGIDADETDAYIIDRLLGEQSPTVNDLSSYVTQDTPAERPFQLADIFPVLPNKPRNNPIRSSNASYALDTSTESSTFDTNSDSKPFADGPSAKYMFAGSGTAQVVAAVPPTIAYATIDETAAPDPTVTFTGEFSPTQGEVFVTTSGSSAGAIAVPVVSWSTSQVIAQLPASAPPAGTLVVAEQGVPSNFVPLTMWSGTYTLSRTYALAGNGSGSFAYSANLHVNLRADVHTWRRSVDGPLAVADFVAQPMRTSTGTIAAKAGSYTATAMPGDSQPPLMTTFSSMGPIALTPYPTIAATNGTLDNYFSILPSAQDTVATQAGCNRGSAFDFGDANFAHYCTSIQAVSSDIATCSDNQNGTSCEDNAANALPMSGAFDTASMYGSTAISAFQLVLNSAYGITVDFNPPVDTGADSLFLNYFPSTASTTWTASFAPPSFPPSSTTPGFRSR